ncbi:MAG: S8 family serine peptidase [Bacteroidota bacterium]
MDWKLPPFAPFLKVIIFIAVTTTSVLAQSGTVPGELLIEIKDQADKEMLILKSGAFELKAQLREDTYLWQIPLPVTIDGRHFTNMDFLTAYLNALPSVEHAEQNTYITLLAQPDDVHFSSQWALNNNGVSGGFQDADIDAVEAWDISNVSPEVIVGILDSGIDWTHPDLIDNIWQNLDEDLDDDGVLEWDGNQWILDPDDLDGIDTDNNGYPDDLIGWDFVDNDNNPYDGLGHGTHVAGIIGAEGNNGIGVAGISWDIQLMPLKIFNDAGAGTNAMAIEALAYATQNGAQITNNSWGGGLPSQFLYDEIEDAELAGRYFVAAAGNSYNNNNDLDPVYPACYDLDNIISVSATDQYDQLAGFSNIGETTVDILAPGKQIYSTLPQNAYGAWSGTSMAAPHVTGALALYIDAIPEITLESAKTHLLNSVNYFSDFTGTCVSTGRLNLNSFLADPSGNLISAAFTYEIIDDTVEFSPINDTIPDAFYKWDFGDGTISIEKYPTHQYEQPGVYQVNLQMNTIASEDLYSIHLAICDNSATQLYCDSLNLVAFYRSTDGDNWINSWELDQPVSNWQGITLNSSFSAVERLELSIQNGLNENNISGNLPNLYLPEIVDFIISFNELEGELNDFSGMPNLEILNLSFNNMDGSIPDFTNLQSLVTLDLSSNNFDGKVPDFNNFPVLKFLTINANNLKGEIPNLEGIPLMNTLSLVDNKLSGTVPNFDFPQAFRIALNANRLTGTIPEFENLSSLFHLNLSANNLEGEIPDFNLPNLNILDLYINNLSGEIPDFEALIDLRELRLYSNNFSGPIPEFLSLTNLQRIDLNNNNLTGNLPGFENSTGLTDVYVHFNKLSGVIPDYSVHPNFANLLANGNNFSGEIPDLSGLQDIFRFEIVENQFNFDITSTNNFSISNFNYAPQDSIGTYRINDTLYVDAGGDLNDNTFTWHFNGIPQAPITGDSSFIAFADGDYYCTVENINIPITGEPVTDLILVSKVISVDLDCFIETSFISNGTSTCSGDSLTFTSTTANANQWEWFVNGNSVGMDSSLTYTFPEEGVHFIALLAGDATCLDSAVGSVQIFPSAEAFNLPDTLIMCASEINLSAPSNDFATFNWFFDGNSIGTTPSFTVSTTGEYVLEITDLCGSMSVTDTVEVIMIDECVWPGDLNFDGQADILDFQAFGLSAGSTGSPRPGATAEWVGQGALPWDSTLPSGVDLKHCDANGDGIISIEDAESIVANFGNTHPDSQPVTQPELPPIATLEPHLNTNSLGSDSLSFNLVLNSIDGNPIDIYSLSGLFTFNSLYTTNDTEVKLDAGNSSLGTQGLDLEQLIIDFPFEKKAWFGVSRTDQQNGISIDDIGTMVISDMNIPTGDGLLSAHEIENVVGLLADGTPVPISGSSIYISSNNPSSDPGVLSGSPFSADFGFYTTVSSYSCESGSHATVYPFLGTEPYTFLWESGNTTPSATGLSPGVYPVTVWDNEGEFRIGGFEVLPGSAIQARIEVFPETSGMNNGSVNAYASGGDGNYSYIWSTGATSDSLTGLSQGNYGLTISDGASCEWSGSFEIKGDVVRLTPKVLLYGAWNNTDSLHNDHLRVQGLIPEDSPFGDLSIPADTVFQVEGRNAIVDWVNLEIRSSNNLNMILATQSGLLQRDGDVVSVDGVSAMEFAGIEPGFYFVVIRHRNHLDVMTAFPVFLDSEFAQLDFSQRSVQGLNARMFDGSKYFLRPGDVDGNWQVNNSDYSIWKAEIGLSGYSGSDLNLDGQVDLQDKTLWLENVGEGKKF